MQMAPAAHLDSMALLVGALRTLVWRAMCCRVAELEGGAVPSRMSPSRFIRKRGRFPVEHTVFGETHQHITIDVGGLRSEHLAAVIAIAQEQKTQTEARDHFAQLLGHHCALGVGALYAPIVQNIDPTA